MHARAFRSLSVLALFVCSACHMSVRPPSAAVTEEILRQSIEFLASSALAGRDNGTEGNRKAMEWIVRNFQKIGLKPGGESGTYLQSFDTVTSGSATNVIALLEGRDRRDEYIVIAVHHDHLGVRNGRMYPGADDNASGVAILMALARRLEEAQVRPSRSILFISFDAEEDGMVGSYYFVKSGLYDIKQIKAMVCLDLVGGNFFPWETQRIYALGAGHDPWMHGRLSELAAGSGLDVVQTGIYLIEPLGPVGARSDYSAFRNRRIPFVFFSTGTPWYYHTPQDTPDRLNYAKMVKLCTLLERYVAELAHRPESYVFVKDPPLIREELLGIKRVLEDAWQNCDRARGGEDAMNTLEESLRTLEGLIQKEKLAPEDRKLIQRTALELLQLTRQIR